MNYEEGKREKLNVKIVSLQFALVNDPMTKWPNGSMELSVRNVFTFGDHGGPFDVSFNAVGQAKCGRLERLNF